MGQRVGRVLRFVALSLFPPMKTLLLRCLLLLACTLSARAADVVSNLGNVSSAQRPLSGAGGSSAQAFDLGSAAGVLGGISVTLQGDGATSQSVRVKLWSSANLTDTTPGTLVEDLGTIPGIISVSDAGYTIASTARPVLAANTRYWVTVTCLTAGGL